MSNHLAIATVTAALRDHLTEELAAYLPGVKVDVGRPQVPAGNNAASPSSSNVTLYLYQVTPNAARRNADLPTRRADGQLLQRPQAALDLHYLLSFPGETASLVPQMLLGAVTQILHSRPVLSRELIEKTVTNTEDPDLQKSDLASALEPVRLTPLVLPLDELNKLWSLFQFPHVLSVAYQASVVLIESKDSTPVPLPVSRPVVVAMPMRQPVIERLGSQVAADQPLLEGRPIQVGHRLVLRGRELLGTDTRVRIGALELTPLASPRSDTELLVELPDTLRIGAQSVQVLHPVDFGEPGVPRLRHAVESGLATFVLSPKAGFTKTSAGLQVDFEPKLHKGQRVVLLLNELEAAPGAQARSYGFPMTVGTGPTTTLTFAMPPEVKGKYLLRVQVDGAVSPVDLGTGQPQVTFT